MKKYNFSFLQKLEYIIVVEFGQLKAKFIKK